MTTTGKANQHVEIGDLEIGQDLPFVLIAGPCQIESRDHALETAEALSDICGEREIGLIYKSSFDKANRTSAGSARGVGLAKGVEILADVREKLGCPVITDVHESKQCADVAEAVDVLQIPAFLCRQTDLLQAAAETGAAVHVKKGQFLAPWDMVHVVDKLEHFGAKRILVGDRGTSFGYNTLVSDFRGLPVMASSGWPVVFDATHSVQQPGGQGADQRWPAAVRAGARSSSARDRHCSTFHRDPSGPGQCAERWPEHGADQQALAYALRSFRTSTGWPRVTLST